MRIIEIEKCGVDECPYCFPHETRGDINYCGAYANHQPEISSKLKTFPFICPLVDIQNYLEV
jgi:hypothetical protein